MTRGILTHRYRALHTAFRCAAERFEVVPFVARIALAIDERGGSATTPELYEDLEQETQVRRGLLTMYDRDLAVGLGIDGGNRRQGIYVRVRLTESGELLAREVRSHLAFLERPQAA